MIPQVIKYNLSENIERVITLHGDIIYTESFYTIIRIKDNKYNLFQRDVSEPIFIQVEYNTCMEWIIQQMRNKNGYHLTQVKPIG